MRRPDIRWDKENENENWYSKWETYKNEKVFHSLHCFDVYFVETIWNLEFNLSIIRCEPLKLESNGFNGHFCMNAMENWLFTVNPALPAVKSIEPQLTCMEISAPEQSEHDFPNCKKLLVFISLAKSDLSTTSPPSFRLLNILFLLKSLKEKIKLNVDHLSVFKEEINLQKSQSQSQCDKSFYSAWNDCDKLMRFSFLLSLQCPFL